MRGTKDQNELRAINGDLRLIVCVWPPPMDVGQTLMVEVLRWPVAGDGGQRPMDGPMELGLCV